MIQVFTNADNLDGHLDHEYDIQQIDNITGLRSAGSSWYKPNKIVLKVKDTGNEYIFKLEKFKLRLDYAQAHELFILLGYLNDTKIEIRKSEVIKSL